MGGLHHGARASAVGVLASVALAAALAGCTTHVEQVGGPPPPPATPAQTRPVSGVIIVPDADMTQEEFDARAQRLWDTGDDTCVAPEGFEDIAAGGTVDLVQPDGSVLTGTIETGVWDSDVMSANGVNGCGFPFRVDGVALLDGTYDISIGSGDRAPFPVSASQIRSGPVLFVG